MILFLIFYQKHLKTCKDEKNKPRQILAWLEIFSASIILELSIWTETIFFLQKGNNHLEFTRIRISFILLNIIL